MLSKAEVGLFLGAGFWLTTTQRMLIKVVNVKMVSQ